MQLFFFRVFVNQFNSLLIRNVKLWFQLAYKLIKKNTFQTYVYINTICGFSLEFRKFQFQELFSFICFKRRLVLKKLGCRIIGFVFLLYTYVNVPFQGAFTPSISTYTRCYLKRFFGMKIEKILLVSRFDHNLTSKFLLIHIIRSWGIFSTCLFLLYVAEECIKHM